MIGSWVVARQFLGWSAFASRVAVVRLTLRYHVEHLCRASHTCAVQANHPESPLSGTSVLWVSCLDPPV